MYSNNIKYLRTTYLPIMHHRATVPKPHHKIIELVNTTIAR